MNELTSSAPRPPYDLDALRRGALSVRHPLTRALLVLTFTTGLIDAVSYLGLGHVFTANMTGNVVLLGFGIAGSGGLPVLAPIISLVAFLAGAVVGGILAQRLLERHPEHLGAALAVEVTLSAIAAEMLLNTLLVLHNDAATALALLTWVVYVPAARRNVDAARRRDAGARTG